MASTSETGHAVNLANFMVLTEGCREFGAVYNPPNSDLSIAEMTTKLNHAQDLHKDYNTALEETKLPINDREILYADLNRVVTRSYHLYLSTRASDQMKKDAKGYMLKITGQNVRVPKLEDGLTADPKHVSNSQQSYTQKAENFERLVMLYKSDLSYAPNETALQIATLEAWVENLKSANDKVVAVTVNAIMKRTARDHALYDAGTGIIDLALACKRYVKGLFGGNSPEARSVVGIRFRRLRKISSV